MLGLQQDGDHDSQIHCLACGQERLHAEDDRRGGARHTPHIQPAGRFLAYQRLIMVMT